MLRSIYLVVVDKLYFQNALAGLEYPNAPEGFLKQTAEWKTSDWLRHYHRQKNLPERQARGSSRSLESPLHKGTDLMLRDIIADENETDPSMSPELKDVLKDMHMLAEEKLWALRLKVMFYDPLAEDELAELALFTKKSCGQVREEVNGVMERLIGRKQMKEADLNLAGKVHSVVLLLQARLLEDVRAMSLSCDERKEREEEIERRARRMETLRRSAGQLIEPSNKEIAAILGIPAEKANTVSVLVFRAREKLKSLKEKRKSEGV